MANRQRVIRVERYRYLQFHPRFQMSVLEASEEPHQGVRGRLVRVPVERFEKQPFGARYVLLNRVAVRITDIEKQDVREADPRLHRAWIHFERALEKPQCLQSDGLRLRP